MLCSCIVEKRDDVGPMGSMFLDILKQDPIFSNCPLAFLYFIVEMVLIPLSTLFWCFKVLSSRFKIKIFGYFVPLSFFEVAG